MLTGCSKCLLRQRPCGGPCACTISGVQWTEHRDRGYCPHPDGPKFGTAVKPDGWDMLPPSGAEEYGPPRPPGVSIVERGRELWAELHKAAPDAAWLEKWEKRIPCGDCRAHWKTLRAELPPDLSSPAAFFEWGWKMHSRVNEKLGKPDVSLEEAARIWRG